MSCSLGSTGLGPRPCAMYCCNLGSIGLVHNITHGRGPSPIDPRLQKRNKGHGPSPTFAYHKNEPLPSPPTRMCDPSPSPPIGMNEPSPSPPPRMSEPSPSPPIRMHDPSPSPPRRVGESVHPIQSSAPPLPPTRQYSRVDMFKESSPPRNRNRDNSPKREP